MTSPRFTHARRPKQFFAGIVLAAQVFLGSALPGQELKKALPQAPPKLVPSQPGELTATNALPVLTHAGAQPGEKVILAKLTGVKFVSTAAQVVSNGVATVGVDMALVPLLQTPEFAQLMKLFLDQPASMASLERITLTARTYLKLMAYPFMSIYLPLQDITGGSVQVVVSAAALDDILRIEGAKYFSEAQYRAAITQRPGEPINAHTLKEDIDWLNRNSFRNVTVVAEPGAKLGTTALKLRTTERLPLRAYTGYNNTGSQVSDEDRLIAGLNWGNAFGLGHQFGYQFSTSPDFKTTLAHSANYAFDLPWRHTVRVTGAYSELQGRVVAPLTLQGRSWQVGLRYDIPLPKLSPNHTHTLTLGADFKASNNNLEFATIPITDNLTHIAQLNLGYEASLTDKWGRTDFGATLNVSPGGIGHRNREQFFTISRAGAESHYAYANFTLARTTRLPGALTWSPRAQFQTASGNLLGSEQMAGGGSGSVRGYEEGEAFGDNGVLLSHELALPAFSLASWFDFKQLGDSLQFFVFQDFALLWSADQLAGERRYTDLHSLGLGCRYQVRNNLSVNFTHGWQLRESHVSRSGEGARSHLSVQASF